MKKTTGFKKKRIKAKIIFAVCLIVFAAAMIAALIAINNANDKQGGSGTSSGGGGQSVGITLPTQDLSDMLNSK